MNGYLMVGLASHSCSVVILVVGGGKETGKVVLLHII